MSTNPQILEKFREQKREEIDPGFDPKRLLQLVYYTGNIEGL